MPVANSRRTYSGGTKATTLAQAAADTATSLTLIDASTFPLASATEKAAVILNRGEPNEEVIFYGPKSGNVLTNVERAQDGTQAFAHGVGESVEHVYTALDANEANAHYANPNPAFVPHAQHVHLASAQTISAAHTFTGNVTHQGNESFSGTVSLTGTANVSTAAITTAPGNPNFTGNPTFATATFANPPTQPMATAVTRVGTEAALVGAGVKPAREDHRHDVDLVGLAKALVPAGKMEPFAGASAPSGYLPCDGAAVGRTVYPALFAALGTTWGSGDGATTFNIPDMRGRIPVGADAAHALGAKGGDVTKTLAVANLPAHNHPVNDPGHKHNSPDVNGFVTGAASSVGLVATTTNQAAIQPNAAGHEVTASTTGVTVGNTGSGAAFNVEQPWAGVTWIIKAH